MEEALPLVNHPWTCPAGLIDGRYRPVTLLSVAHPFQVFQVEDLVTGAQRVLKGVEASPESGPGLALRREFELLSQISHPRVVRAHDLGLCLNRGSVADAANAPALSVGETPASSETSAQSPLLYFTLDYVEGPPLRTLLDAPLSERVHHFVALLDAVAAVHAHGLRCGDLKPENVLLGPEGVALIDFGLSRESESLEVARIPTGTLPYMAPEILRGQAADARSDLFSLGVLLFELLTGSVPFPKADTLSRRLQAWLQLQSPPHELVPPSLQSTLPEGVLVVLDRLLAPRPSARAASCDSIRRLLEGLSARSFSSPHSDDVAWSLPSRAPVLAEQPLLGREGLLESLAELWEKASGVPIDGAGSKSVAVASPASGSSTSASSARGAAPERGVSARASSHEGFEDAGPSPDFLLVSAPASAAPAPSEAHRVVTLRGVQGMGRSRVLKSLALQWVVPAGGRLLHVRQEQASPVALESLRRFMLDWCRGSVQVDGLPGWLQQLGLKHASRESHGALPVLLLDGLTLSSLIHADADAQAGAQNGAQARGLDLAKASKPLPFFVIQVPSGSDSTVRDDAEAHAHQPWPSLDIELPPLPASAIKTLVEQASGLVRAPETIARFHRFSEGNPGILRAILRHPNEMLTPSPALMALLEPLVAEALQSLPPDLLTLARIAAIHFEPFGLDALGAVAELPRDMLPGSLQRLTQAGVLVVDPDVAVGWRFAHPMQRAVLAAQLSESRRKDLHQRSGRLLERLAQFGAAIPNAALAWHWDRADEPERARKYLGRALRDAVAASRQLEAHDLCQRLLERLAADDPERVRIFTQLGDINLALQRFPLAESSFMSALSALDSEHESGNDDGSDPLLLQLQGELWGRLGRAREEQGDFVGAREALERSLALLAQSDGARGSLNSPEAGRLALSLARVCHREGRLDAARKVLSQGLQALELDPRPTELTEALLLDGLIRLDSGAQEEAAAPLLRALELATVHQLPAQRMRALHNLHIVEARRGQLGKAVEYLQQALDLAESLGDVARLGSGYNNLGNLQRRLGDVRRALKSYRQAARTFERVGDRAGLVAVHYSQANLLRERGEFARSLEHLDAADGLAEAIGGGFKEQALRRTRLLRGEVLLALGQLDEAARMLEQSRRESEAGGDAEGLLASELGLAEVSLSRGDTHGAEQRLIELAGRVRPGRQELGFYRTMGRLHFHLGHFYSNTYVQRCKEQGRQILGHALLEQVEASLPEGGALTLRERLTQAITHLEAGGQGQLAGRARALVQGLGSSSEERLELLGAVLDVLQHLGDRRKVLAYLVSLAARVLQAERGLLLYRRNAGELIDFTVLHGMNLGEAQRASGEIVRRVAKAKAPVLIQDALEDPSLIGSASIHDLQIRSVLGLPLEGDSEGLWILYLDHRQLPGLFTDDMAPLLERLRQFASGLLKEIRWRETMLARLQAPARDARRLGMVGVSREIERVREYIENLGHLKLSNENLLFIGESGTGKELVARAVHEVVSAGKEIPFIAQSCSDIPAELIESILFGHRRGSFTGAKDDRPGIFELANGGVLFLDEIGELPLHLQPSLLRVLEERTVARIGEPEKPRSLNLVVVFATNRDLAKEVEAGRFRRDLFHRLNQVFRLPPLRERREDILPLVEHFMGQVEDYRGLTVEELFSPEVLLWFHEYSWPGNIRELRNMVEAIPVRIKARKRQPVLLEDVGARPESELSTSSTSSPAGFMPTGHLEHLKDFTERMETAYIRRVMEQCQWDITSAAAILGITYQGLRKRILRYEWMNEVERRR